MAVAMGSQAKVGMINEVTAGTAVVVTELYELISGDMGSIEELLDTGGITGTRAHLSERVRQNIRRCTGSITLNPNAIELDNLLPRILGTAEVVDVFDLAETLLPFTINIDRGPRRFYYAGCFVNKATFRASAGQALTVQLDIEAFTETSDSTAFPAITLNLATGPYLFSDAVISVSGTNYAFKSWELVVDNMLDTERFLNSTTRAALPAKDRMVSVTLDAPYGTPAADNTALYGLAATGVAVIATFTNAQATGVSCIFNCPKVSFPRISPILSGKEELMIPLRGIARKGTGSFEIRVTNDSLP